MATRTNSQVVMNGSSNKQPRPRLRQKSHRSSVGKTRRGFASTLTSVAIRLFAWYSLITIGVRCPSSYLDLTTDSPRICRPYLAARTYVAPRLEPYYDAYAAPYVETARPYVQTFNAKVLDPTIELGRQNYESYGAPYVQRAKLYGQEKWAQDIRPRMDAFATDAGRGYHTTVAPHVHRAMEAASPYYIAAKDRSSDVYQSHLLPAYTVSMPYAHQAYSVGHSFVFDTAAKHADSAWTATSTIVTRTVWPRIRILYGENVEPQLTRIGERLGRYRDRKKLESVVSEVDRSTTESSTSTESSVASSSSAAATSASSTVEQHSAKPSIEAEKVSDTRAQKMKEDVDKAREVVANDLKTWEEKFAKVSEKGAEDLEGRVKEITDHYMQSQIQGVGEALLVELEETAKAHIEKVKATTLSVVEEASRDSEDVDEAQGEKRVDEAVSQSALAVRGKAQALRKWKQKSHNETWSLIEQATYSTLAVIDEIRDLGLQEIGMKWTWMDGITYKDWAKFHELRKTVDDWKREVLSVAKHHKGLDRANEAADEIESKGMVVAEDAAKELARLKKVATWKLAAQDATDDFSHKYAPPAVANAGQVVMDRAKDVREKVKQVAGSGSSYMAGVSEDSKEASSSASAHSLPSEQGTVEQATSKLSQSIYGTEQPVAESVVSHATVKAAEASGRVVDSVSVDAEIVDEGAKSQGSSASSAAVEAVYKDSEAALGSEEQDSFSKQPGVSEEIDGASVKSTVSRATDALSDEVSTPGGAAASASSVADQASSGASQASKKVWGGAAAEPVGDRQIVLDMVDDNDDEESKSSFSDTIQSMAGEAGESLNDLTRAVREALYGTTTTQGSVESVTSLASEQYSRALSAASSVLYGTPQGTAESVADVASKRYAQAVAAASSVVYGTPSPTHDSIAAQASSQYFNAISKAQEQFARAKLSLSSQSDGAAVPSGDSMLASIEAAYSDSVHAANERLQSAKSALSTGIYGTPLSPRESLSSVANRRYSEALAAASSQYQQAKVAVGGSPTTVAEYLSSAADKHYFDLVSRASSQYASATSAASTAYYGPSQGPLESISSIASSRLAEGVLAASEQFDRVKYAAQASPTGVQHQYVLDARRRYYEALGLAHDQYSVFVGSASSAVYGTPTPTIESLSSRASDAVFATAAPAVQSALAAAKSQYSNAVDGASSQLAQLLQQASSAAGQTSQSPAGSVLSAASSRYSAALSAASASLYSASAAASTAAYGTSTGSIESIASAISEKADSVASVASSQVVGSETHWTESVASVASQNWEGLVSKASEQIYGTPTQVTESLFSQAGDYAAQATAGAVAQVEAMRALVSELISGREPAYTESVFGRLNSAFYTGAPAMALSASSYASEAYNSASSVAASVFTPPPTVESILAAAGEQISSAVDAASIQMYGTTTGTFESASSAVASQAASLRSKVNEAMYGRETGYAEAAQSQIAEAASSAQAAIFAAIYGTSSVTGSLEQATGAAAAAYSSASSSLSEAVSAAGEMAGRQQSAVKASVSSALYGEQQGVVESAQGKLGQALESARARLAEMAEAVADGAQQAASSASEGVSSVVSRGSSVIIGDDESGSSSTTSSITSTITTTQTAKDEL